MSILRADSIRDRAGTGAPDFPNGLTGNVTGTASTATVATNAQGITGTPNITVGTVTGTDATFSGNLTVNGTTTTIDTAVTAVDSLAVDGNITSGGTIWGGTTDGGVTATTSYASRLYNNSAFPSVWAKNSGNGGLWEGVNSSGTQTSKINSDGSANFAGAVDVGTFSSGTSGIRLTNSGTIYVGGTGANAALNIGNNSAVLNYDGSSAFSGTAIFKGGLAEKNVNGTTLAAASNNIALSSGNVHRFTGDESGAKTVNFTGVDSTLAAGESVSFTVILTPNNSGYINAVTVDGATPGTATKWSGGSAPSSGSNGGRDVYTFTIFKYGTAVTDNEVYGAVTNYG